jgi:tetratricopeptide (TPR) repeat protein
VSTLLSVSAVAACGDDGGKSPDAQVIDVGFNKPSAAVHAHMETSPGVWSDLGVANLAVKRYSESEKFHKLAISRCSELGIQEQCSMGNLTQNLGSCYLWSEDLEKAKETISLALSQTNKNRERALYTYGNLMLRLKRYDEALALHKEVLQTYLSDLGPEHPITADSWHKVGRIFTTADYSGSNLKEAE